MHKNQTPSISSCGSCYMLKNCLMAKADLANMLQESIELHARIAHANEYISTDFIEKNQIIIVRTGAVIKEYADAKGSISLIDIYYPGDMIVDYSETEVHYTIRLKSIETSSLCYLNTSVFNITPLYTEFLTIRLKNLEESNSFKQFLLVHKDPIKRVLLFILTIVKKKHAFLCDDIEIKINLSRKQIGIYLGLAEETVIRALRYLSDLGLLNVNSKNFIIPQYKKLINFYTISQNDSTKSQEAH